MPRAPDVIAEGPGYFLRSLSLDDAEPLAAFSQDQAYWRYLSHGPRTPDQVRTFVESAVVASDRREVPEWWWAVVDPESDALIGTANLKRLGRSDALFGSVGCTLAPCAQGKRLGIGVGWGVIVLAFEHFKLSRIECTCAKDNERSFHLMQDIIKIPYDGMREDSVPGREAPWPVHVFSWTRADYQERAKTFSI